MMQKVICLKDRDYLLKYESDRPTGGLRIDQTQKYLLNGEV